MIKVIIVDDHPVVRHGLQQIVEAEPDMRIVEQAGDARSAIAAVRHTACDVVILDITLPGISGIEVLNQIRHEYPHLPVLIMSMHEEEEYAIRVLKAGASGYLTKDSIPVELIKAIRKITEGGRYINTSISDELVSMRDKTERPPHSRLSDREFQIMCMIAQGHALKDIGEALCISDKTVSTYRSRILEKMGMKTNADMVRYALQHKLIA